MHLVAPRLAARFCAARLALRALAGSLIHRPYARSLHLPGHGTGAQASCLRPVRQQAREQIGIAWPVSLALPGAAIGAAVSSAPCVRELPRTADRETKHSAKPAVRQCSV